MCVVQGVLTGVQVQQVLFPEKLDYPLVVLAPGTTRQQLEDMQVDIRRLEALVDKKHVTGMCVTCAGTTPNLANMHKCSMFLVQMDTFTAHPAAKLNKFWLS